MRIRFTVLLWLVASICMAQTTGRPSLKKFARKWKADINGLNGFRESHVDSISVNYKTHIGKGVNINGFTQAQVIAILGNPAGSGRHIEDYGLQMFYPVKRKSKHEQPELELVILFDENDVVADLAHSWGVSSKKAFNLPE